MADSTYVDPNERPINWPACIEAGLLAVTAALLLTKVARGVMVFYIHPRYNLLVVASALVLLAIAGVRLRQIFIEQPESMAGRGPMYLLLALPLLLGTFVPAQPLDGSLLMNRSVDSFGSGNGRWTSQSASEDTRTWHLLHWVSALGQNNAALQGQPVLVEGFVLRPPEVTDNSTFYVVRYTVTCCAADGAGVGLPVVWDNNAAFADNDWLAVEGTLGSAVVGGSERPAIIASRVTPIDQPQNPYLYP